MMPRLVKLVRDRYFNGQTIATRHWVGSQRQALRIRDESSLSGIELYGDEIALNEPYTQLPAPHRDGTGREGDAFGSIKNKGK